MIKTLITILSLTTSTVFAIPLTAQSWLVTDHNGVLLEGSNTTEIRSIASITKLMTSMVVLDSGQSLTEIIPKKLYNKQLTRETLIVITILAAITVVLQQ